MSGKSKLSRYVSHLVNLPAGLWEVWVDFAAVARGVPWLPADPSVFAEFKFLATSGMGDVAYSETKARVCAIDALRLAAEYRSRGHMPSRSTLRPLDACVEFIKGLHPFAPRCCGTTIPVRARGGRAVLLRAS